MSIFIQNQYLTRLYAPFSQLSLGALVRGSLPADVAAHLHSLAAVLREGDVCTSVEPRVRNAAIGAINAITGKMGGRGGRMG